MTDVLFIPRELILARQRDMQIFGYIQTCGYCNRPVDNVVYVPNFGMCLDICCKTCREEYE